MTLYCRNGHPLAEPPPTAGCPTCHQPPSERLEPTHLPIWPIAGVLTICAIIVLILWWQLWFADP